MPSADLAVLQSVSTNLIVFTPPVEDLVVGVTVTNQGPTAAAGVIVTDWLVFGDRWVSAVQAFEALADPSISQLFNLKSVFVSQGTASVTNGLIVCDFGVLDPHTTANAIFTIQPSTTGTLFYSAQVNSDTDDLNLFDNYGVVSARSIATNELLVRSLSADEFEISWSVEAKSFVVQVTDTPLLPNSWQDLKRDPVVQGKSKKLVEAIGGAKFYRLIQR